LVFSRYKSFIIRDYKEPDNHKLWQVVPLGMVLKENNLKYDNSKETVDFLIKNSNNIFRTAINRSFDYTPYNRDEFNLINRGNNKIYIYKGEDLNFASYKINSIEGKLTPTSVIGDIWTDIGINNLSNEGGVSLRFGKKPEKLLERIISLFSQENDLVLDYHIGSGTTAAVAHKMNRQYIGIEQMDYIEFITLERMKKVLLGDSTGASKSNYFQGGGSFVYAELAKNNETAKERIEACNSLEDLLQLFEELNTRYFLDYNVRIKDFKENVIKEEAFINLSLARQKELFKRMLDNNQLYVNLSEVEDTRYNLSEDAIRLTKDFYQIKN
jgi:adenine-specific DNA-methyltransferase